ncbi:MAG: DUF3987 domain-containing protein [Proteobacteria bacterium]|nr:DUF3987 domain-containing protein [Pseudomonadota bacterium]
MQSPIPLITASALSTLSMASQGLIDVAMPTGQVAPVSLFFLTSAESGERKTATDRILTAPVSALQAEWAIDTQAERVNLATQLQLWEIECGVIEGKLRRALKKNQPCEDLKSQFAAHQNAKPEPRQIPHLMYADTTVEAMLANMHATWPHAALVSDEGGGILGGHALRHLGVINQIWDGVDTIRVDRKTGGSFTLEGARLSLAVMAQRAPLDAFARRKDGEAMEIGFLARLLVAEPMSRQGTRQANAGINEVGQAALNVFHARVRELLLSSRKNHTEGRPRTTLAFNPEATAMWLQFAAWVESQLGAGGLFEDVRGFASKLTNHMSRLAALIHFFQGSGTLIDAASTDCAIKLAHWYALEFKRLFGTDDPIVIQQRYGDLLWIWLHRQYLQRGRQDFLLTDLYRLAPRKLRKRPDLDIAINDLCARNMAQLFRNAKPAFLRIVPPPVQYGAFLAPQVPSPWSATQSAGNQL